MKKVLFIVLVLVSCLLQNVFSASPQLRDYVGIVRQKNSDETIAALKKNSEIIRKKGFSSFAEYIDEYIESGTFGSGFIYVAADGSNFIITNRHVVNSGSASIEFENAETGEISKYDNLSTYVIDDDIDIAVLRFENDKNPFSRGLRFSAAKLSDGMDVYSAGFPGLGGTPMWQLGKGTVTNAYARIPELMDPAVSTIIQHSAEVDSGNSGGPLLVKNPNSLIGYDVIGVNTWKAVYRQNANYSIPANVVQKIINRKIQSQSKVKVAATQVEKLISVLNSTDESFEKVAVMMSYKAALESGGESFVNALRYGSTSAVSTVKNVFLRFPADGLRYAMAADLVKTYQVKDDTTDKFSFDSIEEKDDVYIAVIKLGTEKMKVTCRYENGVCHIDGIEAPETQKPQNANEKSVTQKAAKEKKLEKKENVAVLTSPSIFDIMAGCAIKPGSDKTDFGFKTGFDYWFDYMGFGVGVCFLPIEGEQTLFFNGNFIARVPFNINDTVSIIPLAKAGVGGANVPSYGIMLGFNLEGGLEFMITGDSYVKPAFGVTYQFVKLNKSSLIDFYTKEIKEDTISVINVYAKLCF